MNLKDSFISLDMTLTGDESRELSKKLIDTYFRTVPYPYTKHHIDSYDQFLQQDLINIIRSNNPIIILKDLIEYYIQMRHVCEI